LTEKQDESNDVNRVLLNVLNCMRINRNKANGKYAEFAGCGDDRDPEFLMIL